VYDLVLERRLIVRNTIGTILKVVQSLRDEWDGAYVLQTPQV